MSNLLLLNASFINIYIFFFILSGFVIEYNFIGWKHDVGIIKRKKAESVASAE